MRIVLIGVLMVFFSVPGVTAVDLSSVCPEAVCPSCATVVDPVVNWCRGCSWPLAEIRQSFDNWLAEDAPRGRQDNWTFRHLPGPGSDTVSTELVMRGFAALDHRQLQGAENFARSARRRAVWNPDSYRILARLAILQRDHGAAVHYYTRLLEVSPLDSEARNYLVGTPELP